ncbi:MAG: type II/IV secretion system protein [Sedimentisphaerales bacterium]|nr:type II/IV secretion system protein [Sedimentisphaerales bacterium]
MKEHDPIIAALLSENVLDESQAQVLEDRQKASGESLFSIIQREVSLDEEQAARVTAVAHNITFVNLSPDMIDPIVAHLISQEVANRYSVIPIKRQGRELTVAMSSPLNLRARDEIELKTGYTVVPVAATPHAIHQAIRFHFDVASLTKQTIASMRLKGDLAEDGKSVADKSDRLFDADSDPITKLVASIIRGGIDVRASDIHIEPQESDLRVRYRVDGLLRKAIDVPASAQREVISHLKVLADMDISERRIPQDGHITIRHEDREYDLRVSSLPAVGGEKIVLRILDKNAGRWSLDRVVTSPQDNRRIRDLVANPYGMILLTGPTGSGKTTTLYSVLQLVNTPERNIVTVEDPVEYRLPGITQVQVKPVAGVTFATTLRSILRQDPNIILVGEIRDLETAEIAVSAALTGHLVLSTLHTNDAAGAVSRLVSIGIPPFLVASSLLGAVAQRLVRTVCPKCKEPYTPGEEERALLDDETVKVDRLCHGKGCHNCYGSGYQSRKSVYEILSVSPTIQRMIVDGKSDTVIKKQAVQEGMRTLRTSALDEVRGGATTVNEIMRVVDLRSE